MSIEMAKSIIAQHLNTNKYDVLAINLFGGEPFLRFDFIKELCEWTWAQNWPQKYIFYADTNGVNLTEEIKIWTSQNKDRFIMLLSLDGTPQTHNFNRSNSFDLIDIDFFIKHWPKQGVKMTISEWRLENLANDIIYLHSKGLKIKGANLAEGILIKDFDKKFEILMEQYRILVDWYVLHPDIPVAQIFDLNLSICESHKNIPIKYCGCGSPATKVIDIDGKEYPCTYFFPLSMSSSALKEIEKYDLSNNCLFINKDCLTNCYIYPICKGCYGDNFTTTGLLHKRSKQKCKLSKLRAVAVANLRAKQILLNRPSVLTKEERDEIIAIQKINTLFANTELPIAEEKVEAL